jgi:hypothetical protein
MRQMLSESLDYAAVHRIWLSKLLLGWRWLCVHPPAHAMPGHRSAERALAAFSAMDKIQDTQLAGRLFALRIEALLNSQTLTPTLKCSIHEHGCPITF